MSMLFAATYPERASALGVLPSVSGAAIYPWAPTVEERQRTYEVGGAGQRGWTWSTSRRASSPRSWSASRPTSVAARAPAPLLPCCRMNTETTDCVIQAPALVMHRSGDRDAHIDEGRYLAAHVPARPLFPACPSGAGAGRDRRGRGARRSGLCPILTASSRRCLSRTSSVDRSPAEVGDRRWTELARHDAIAGKLERFRGREIDTAGDGFLATFDGPARAIRCALATQTFDARAGPRAARRAAHGRMRAAAQGARDRGARVAALAQAGEVLVSSTSCATSSPAPASPLKRAASTVSRASAHGRSTRWPPDDEELTLLDWKRRIFDLYAAVRAAPDPSHAGRRWRRDTRRLGTHPAVPGCRGGPEVVHRPPLLRLQPVVPRRRETVATPVLRDAPTSGERP